MTVLLQLLQHMMYTSFIVLVAVLLIITLSYCCADNVYCVTPTVTSCSSCPHNIHCPTLSEYYKKLKCTLPPTLLWCSCQVTILLIQTSQLQIPCGRCTICVVQDTHPVKGIYLHMLDIPWGVYLGTHPVKGIYLHMLDIPWGVYLGTHPVKGIYLQMLDIPWGVYLGTHPVKGINLHMLDIPCGRPSNVLYLLCERYTWVHILWRYLEIVINNYCYRSKVAITRQNGYKQFHLVCTYLMFVFIFEWAFRKESRYSCDFTNCMYWLLIDLTISSLK